MIDFTEMLNRAAKNRYFILDENEVIHPVSNIMELAGQFPKSLARTWIATRRQSSFISTIFLGINHSWDDTRPPVLFETMVFDGKRNDVFQDRYETIGEARVGHVVAVAEGFRVVAGYVSGRKRTLCKRSGHVALFASDGSHGCQRCGLMLHAATPVDEEEPNDTIKKLIKRELEQADAKMRKRMKKLRRQVRRDSKRDD